jgi:hypothetical protein
MCSTLAQKPCVLQVCLFLLSNIKKLILLVILAARTCSDRNCCRSGRREDVEILFPITSCIPTVRDWSVDGIISHVKLVRQVKV